MKHTILKQNKTTKNKSKSTTTSQPKDILLPLPPIDAQAKEEMAIYARFMRHLRHVPGSRKEIKVLSAIQFTADMLDYSDATIAKILVEMGLRAPRIAYPSEFLNFVDQALAKDGWEIGAPTQSLLDLKAYWNDIGEEKFAVFKGTYCQLSEPVANANHKPS